MNSFSPTINANGQTVTPKGYEWVLGFALAGCEWAIEEASKPEFLEMVRADLKREVIIKLEAEIASYERRIEELKDNLKRYT